MQILITVNKDNISFGRAGSNVAFKLTLTKNWTKVSGAELTNIIKHLTEDVQIPYHPFLDNK